jgi:putative Mn2+ efflux pump MntP
MMVMTAAITTGAASAILMFCGLWMVAQALKEVAAAIRATERGEKARAKEG